MAKPKKVLIISFDPQLADVRKSVLEGAGFQVFQAGNLLEVRKHCAENTLDLVMIGYSLPAAEKRRVWAEIREHCSTILELHREGGPALTEAAYYHSSHSPDDFLDAVKSALQKQ